MELHVIGSGSAGNCYVLNGTTSALVIECGIAPEKMLQRVNIAPSKIAGALVSHEHGDHAGFVGRFAEYGIDIFTSAGTAANCKIKSRRRVRHISALQSYRIGEFTVKAFQTEHDAAEPLGFLIEHPEMGLLLFVTDTHFVRYNFNSWNVNHIMIEANYDDNIIDARTASGEIMPSQAERVRRSHLSIDQAGKFIAANATPSLNNVVLIHLSSGNANADAFAEKAAKNAPFSHVLVAVKDLVIELNKSEI